MRRGTGPDEFLLEVSRAADVEAVRGRLAAAGIFYRTGLMSGARPRVLFFVPRERLDEARGILDASAALDDSRSDRDDVEEQPAPPAAAARFPWWEVWLASVPLFVHLLLVAWIVGPLPPGQALLERGGLIAGGTAEQPWRLLTSLALHVDPPHALWNGLALLVFAVPLLERLGWVRSALIYLVAGVGGGITALTFAAQGTVIVGSSGAVSGLFGAWLALTWVEAHGHPLTWRSRMRTIGVALLFLPSLINPADASGRPVSVSSHLGGMATGMLVGALLSGWMVRLASRLRRRPDADDTEAG